MKKYIGRFVLSPEFQLSIFGGWLRGFTRLTRSLYNYSPYFLLDSQSLERPHYAYCMLHAAELAKSLGHSRISALEFGVAGGNGIKFMCEFASEVERATGVAVDCYGFDTGEGMPPPKGPRDLPYWFQEAQYVMDEEALRLRAPAAKLIIGQVRDTITNFISSYQPAPIGIILFDMDYWSSTKDSFHLFDDYVKNSDNFLPRIFMYFDDVIGTHYEMYGPFNGQLGALSAFNETRSDIKVHLNQNLISQKHLNYSHQIYYAHLFEHPSYSVYIGEGRQEGLKNELRLKA